MGDFKITACPEALEERSLSSSIKTQHHSTSSPQTWGASPKGLASRRGQLNSYKKHSKNTI